MGANPRFANPGVAEKAPWRSLQSGVAGVYSLLEIPTDSCHFPSHLTSSSDPNTHCARKALSATPGLARGGLGTCQNYSLVDPDNVGSAPRMTGRRSHWTEPGDDNIFLRLAIVVRLFLLWLRMGLLSWHPLV